MLAAIVRDKLAMFALAGGCAAFLGSTFGFSFRTVPIFGISIWDAVIGAVVAVAIALAQDLYLKRAKRGLEGLKRFGLLGAKAGAVGGAGLVGVQILAGRGPLSMTAAWAMESCLMGILIAPIIPNLPVTKVAKFGALAGGLGAMIMMVLGSSGIPGVISVALGDSLKGLLLGAAMTMAERSANSPSITVYWSPKESSILLLGEQPIAFGSGREAHVFISDKEAVPPIAATITMKLGKAILDDRVRQRESCLVAGQRLTLGDVQVVVNL